MTKTQRIGTTQTMAIGTMTKTMEQEQLLQRMIHEVFGVLSTFSWAHKCQHSFKCTRSQNSCIMTVSSLVSVLSMK